MTSEIRALLADAAKGLRGGGLKVLNEDAEKWESVHKALLTRIDAALAGPAVEWRETVNDTGDPRRIERPYFSAQIAGLDLRVQWDPDEGGEAWRAWVLDPIKPKGERVVVEPTRHVTLDAAKAAAELAAGVT